MEELAPLCACGCGERVKRKTYYPYSWNKFIIGHHVRIKDKYAEEKSKPAPLCKCGCGQPVKWNKKRWGSFLDGHCLKIIWKSRKKDMTKILTIQCEECGKEFEKYKSNIKYKHNFCGRLCSAKFHSGENNSMKRLEVRIKRSGNNNSNWKGGITFKKIKCDYCKEVFLQQSSKIKRNQKNFCSLKCCNKWKSENVIKINHPNWKGGISTTKKEYRENIKQLAKKLNKNPTETRQLLKEIYDGKVTQTKKEIRHVYNNTRY